MTRLLQFFAHADTRTKCKSGETVEECAKRFNVDVDQVYVHGKKLESGGSAAAICSSLIWIVVTAHVISFYPLDIVI